MLLAAVPLLICFFVFMLFRLHDDCQNLVLDHVLLIVPRHFLIVVQVGGCHQSLQKLLINFILLLLLCFIFLIFVLTVVELSILSAKLTFLLNVDYFRVVDTDWAGHSLLPHDFVYEIYGVRWKLEALDRIFLGN